MIRLSLKYMRFFKQQSLYVLMGIIATVAIITAINSAFETNNRMELERARQIFGDYHYAYNKLSEKEIEKAYNLTQECNIERIGYLRIGKGYGGYDNPTVIGLKSMDAGYQEMVGIELLEGRYPKAAGEIALEEWVLTYFTDEGIGAQIKLDGDIYVVTGILKDRETDKGFGLKNGYISEADTEGGYYQLYIKYDESKNIKNLQADFSEKFGHAEKAIQNREISFKLIYSF